MGLLVDFVCACLTQRLISENLRNLLIGNLIHSLRFKVPYLDDEKKTASAKDFALSSLISAPKLKHLILLTSPRPNSSPSPNQIQRESGYLPSDICKGKVEFGLWAVTKISCMG